jgi:hypothetical protein
MEWLETLTDIFAGYVNQQTLEEGVVQMVFVCSGNPEYHSRFLDAIEHGLEATRTENSSVLAVINKSGYRVSTMREASDLLLEMRSLYLQRIQKTDSDSQQDVPEVSDAEIQRRMNERSYSTAEVLAHLKKLEP